MTRLPIRSAAVTGAALLAIGLAACGGGSSSSTSAASTGASSAKPANPAAPEVSPSGDIPDNQAYVAYALPGAGVSVKVPEGWSRTATPAGTAFSDKLNSIAMAVHASKTAPTAASVRTTELPQLARSTAGYRSGTVTVVKRPAGSAVRITYLAAGPADQVTGKSRTNAVERYLFDHNGRQLVLTLSGPKGADNVDPWKIVTDSVRWTR
jgi:hypothetical protein